MERMGKSPKGNGRSRGYPYERSKTVGEIMKVISRVVAENSAARIEGDFFHGEEGALGRHLHLPSWRRKAFDRTLSSGLPSVIDRARIEVCRLTYMSGDTDPFIITEVKEQDLVTKVRSIYYEEKDVCTECMHVLLDGRTPPTLFPVWSADDERTEFSVSKYGNFYSAFPCEGCGRCTVGEQGQLSILGSREHVGDVFLGNLSVISISLRDGIKNLY